MYSLGEAAKIRKYEQDKSNLALGINNSEKDTRSLLIAAHFKFLMPFVMANIIHRNILKWECR